jgi:hypothetical protein
VLADDDHFFADEFFDVCSTFARRGEGALDFFAVHFNDEGLGISVEGLELAGVSNGFSAACLAGNDGQADEGEGAEDGFHEDVDLNTELPFGDCRIRAFDSLRRIF